jgi:hypothetical protein
MIRLKDFGRVLKDVLAHDGLRRKTARPGR